MEDLLQVKDLEISFFTDLGESKAVRNASYTVKKGEVFGIVGESGSGKSVGTKAILRLGPPNCRIKNGSILFHGRDILSLKDSELRALRGGAISMVFQDSLSALNPVYTVGSKMVELLRRHDKKLSKADARQKVLRLLDDVGIAEPARAFDSYPHELSGGMRQRIMIAMAVSCDPELLIADEPTTALDVTIQAQILHLLRDVQRARGLSVILITHDLGVVAQLCQRVAVMCGGYVVEEGSVGEIFHNPRHPYTQALLASMPRAGSDKLEQFLERSKGGEEEYDGLCPFCSRCPRATDRCRRGLPAMREVEPRHRVLCFEEEA